MDPFKYYTYEEAIGHETGFKKSHPKGYSRLFNNIQRVGNMIYK